MAAALIPTEAKSAIPHEAQITPGQLRGLAHAPGDPWVYGYWEYLPANFEDVAPDPLPLLVFLPGIGEYDDVSSCPGGADFCSADDCGSDGLCRNLTWGPQQLMQLDQWDDVQRPFIMVSPQHPVPEFTTAPWDVDMLDGFVQFVVDNYPVDQRRMYLIGMSQGGRGTLQYTQAYPRRFTAIAPAPGGEVDVDASCFFEDTALWVFHGENDTDENLGPGVFDPCTMVALAHQYDNPGDSVGSPQCVSIADQPRPEARLTIFEDVAHFSWVQAFDPINSGFPAVEWASDQGCGVPATFRQYEAALDPDGLYSWFLSLDRPRVVAPDDVLVDLPQTSLSATITDDDPVTIAWAQLDGPAATLSDTDTDTLGVSDLLPDEQYTFEVYVLDADNQWDRDQVEVTTAKSLGEGGSSSSDGGSTGDTGGASSTSAGTDAGTDDRGTTSGGSTLSGGSTTSGGSPTSGGPMATDSGNGPTTSTGSSQTDDTTDDDGAVTETPDGTGGPVDPSGAPQTGDASDSSGGPPAADGDDRGCGCTSGPPAPAGWWALAIVMLAIRRRSDGG